MKHHRLCSNSHKTVEGEKNFANVIDREKRKRSTKQLHPQERTDAI